MTTSRYLRAACPAAMAACLLALVSACAIPSRPAWWPKPQHTTAAAAAGSNVNARAVTTVLGVAQRWHPGLRQLGIQVYWTANTHDSDAVVRAKARRITNSAIRLNANSIPVTVPCYAHGVTSDAGYTSPITT